MTRTWEWAIAEDYKDILSEPKNHMTTIEEWTTVFDSKKVKWTTTNDDQGCEVNHIAQRPYLKSEPKYMMPTVL